MVDLTKEEIQQMIENEEVGIVYPKDKSQESATILANIIEAAIGVATITGDDGETFYGVLVKKDDNNGQV